MPERKQPKQPNPMFEKEKIYPLYQNYGKIMQYEEVALTVPEQRQYRQPGVESDMVPRPIVENKNYVGSGKLTGKVALITGGDSGMDAAAEIAVVKEKASFTISNIVKHEDAELIIVSISHNVCKCLLIDVDSPYNQ